ncbi:hypothetical protein BDN72DRAFT_866115, partial [Pluteus cervinus]
NVDELLPRKPRTRLLFALQLQRVEVKEEDIEETIQESPSLADTELLSEPVTNDPTSGENAGPITHLAESTHEDIPDDAQSEQGGHENLGDDTILVGSGDHQEHSTTPRRFSEVPRSQIQQIAAEALASEEDVVGNGQMEREELPDLQGSRDPPQTPPARRIRRHSVLTPENPSQFGTDQLSKRLKLVKRTVMNWFTIANHIASNSACPSYRPWAFGGFHVLSTANHLTLSYNDFYRFKPLDEEVIAAIIGWGRSNFTLWPPERLLFGRWNHRQLVPKQVQKLKKGFKDGINCYGPGNAIPIVLKLSQLRKATCQNPFVRPDEIPEFGLKDIEGVLQAANGQHRYAALMEMLKEIREAKAKGKSKPGDEEVTGDWLFTFLDVDKLSLEALQHISKNSIETVFTATKDEKIITVLTGLRNKTTFKEREEYLAAQLRKSGYSKMRRIFKAPRVCQMLVDMMDFGFHFPRAPGFTLKWLEQEVVDTFGALYAYIFELDRNILLRLNSPSKDFPSSSDVQQAIRNLKGPAPRIAINQLTEWRSKFDTAPLGSTIPWFDLMPALNELYLQHFQLNDTTIGTARGNRKLRAYRSGWVVFVKKHAS